VAPTKVKFARFKARMRRWIETKKRQSNAKQNEILQKIEVKT
jgi:hypothetical protein